MVRPYLRENEHQKKSNIMKVLILTLIMALPFALLGQEQKKEAGKADCLVVLLAGLSPRYNQMPRAELRGFDPIQVHTEPSFYFLHSHSK